MTSTILATVLIAALSPPMPAQAKPADFTGTWELDTSRSEGVPPEMQQTMTVKQSGDRVEVQTLVKGPQGEQKIPDVYVLDGRENDFTPTVIGGGAGKGKRTARWSEGRNGFETTERATLPGPEGDEVTVTATRKWTLAPDGKTLTIEMTMNGPAGEVTSSRVFTKKSA